MSFSKNFANKNEKRNLQKRNNKQKKLGKRIQKLREKSKKNHKSNSNSEEQNSQENSEKNSPEEAKVKRKRVYRINFAMLRHLVRAEFFAQIFVENKSSQDFLILETLFACSLNLISWESKKSEKIDLHAVLEKLGAENLFSELGEKILNSLEKLAEANPDFFALDLENSVFTVKSRQMVRFFQREYLENYLIQRHDIEHLRVLKAADVLRGNVEKTLQEFCLLPVKTFRKIMNTLLEQNFMGKNLFDK